MDARQQWEIRVLRNHIDGWLARRMGAHEAQGDVEDLACFDELFQTINESFEVVRLGQDCPEKDTVIVAYCETFAPFHLLRLLPQERLALYECGLNAATRIGRDFSIGQMNRLLGTAFNSMHLLLEARHYFEESRKYVPRNPIDQHEVEILGSLGNIACQMNDLERAIELQQQALQLAERTVPVLVSKALCSLGITHNRWKRPKNC